MAMHCPQCLTEYRDGFVQCADCRAPLKSGPPPEPAPADLVEENHEVELVTVFETHDSFTLRLAMASLEDADIPYIVNGGARIHDPGATMLPPTSLLGGPDAPGHLRVNPYSIQVARGAQREAQHLLERFSEMRED